MILVVLAVLAVCAALWARTCFANTRLTAGAGRARWHYHGFFWAGVAAGLVGLGLLMRSPGAGLFALGLAAVAIGWAGKLKLDLHRRRGS